MGGTCSKTRGGFRVLSQQSESAVSRPDRAGAEAPAAGHKAAGGPRRHWLDYATAFLTLAAAGGAITAAVFTGWQAVTADQGMRGQQPRLRPLDQFPLRPLRGQERE